MESATERYLVQKNRVRDCIQNLRLKQNKANSSFAALVNEFKILSIRQQTVVREAYWIVPFERNSHFTGRESELARLEGMLFIEDRTTKIAITGLGGIGKTNILIELVHRTRKKHRNCSIIWLPATNVESLQQSYLNIAQQLGIPGCEDDKADVMRLVQEHLNKGTIGQWLLAFDNADDIHIRIDRPRPEQKYGRLIDYLPRSKQGCIVFTTRDRKMAYELVQQKQNVIEIPNMSEDVATQLLQQYLPDQDLVKQEQDTKALLVQLTYLPLAIVHAASFLNKNDETIASYLSLLAEQEEEVIELLSQDFEDEGRYCDIKNPVATTFLISFEHIRRRDSLAADYLSFLACVDPKNVPQSLLLPGPLRTKEVAAIGTLVAYSFVTRRSADLALDVHQLVHLATRSWLRKEGLLAQWSERAVKRLRDVFPNSEHQNKSVWTTYLAHARYALKSELVDKYKSERILLAHKLGLCLLSDGRFNEAEVLIREVMGTLKEVLGKEHPDTLISMNNLAYLLQSQGKYDAAELMYREALQLSEKVLVKEHPTTIKIMKNLAYLLESRKEHPSTL